MKGLLICPWERTAVQHLSEHASLAAIPLLGQSLVEYWLGHLASTGVDDVLLLADGNPAVLNAAGEGSRWGIRVQTIEESRELTPAQTLLKYEKYLEPTAEDHGVVLMDHLPGFAGRPLFNGYGSFLTALLEWMPRARTPDRVGIKETQPGVWTCRNSQISPEARLIAPCWIGKNTFIGAGAVVGPNAIVEDGSFIESFATISNGLVGAETFIGQCSELTGKLALADRLIDVATGSCARVPDKFVMCGLNSPQPAQSAGWLDR
ncbi:MAG TPA: hypothetical protein VHH88_11735, partial [Verrucomicrobiae bacterium]|nr:hypothetical protein [Verrucomicrobiae bacterium]